MLIYNTTFHIEGQKNVTQFVDYMRNVYYPAALEGNCNVKVKFVRLVTDMGNGMTGFAFMVELDSMSVLKKWKEEIGDRIMEKLLGAMDFQILSFSTTMVDMIGRF